MPKHEPLIYAIENVVTGCRYVGITENWKSRRALHASALRHNRHRNKTSSRGLEYLW